MGGIGGAVDALVNAAAREVDTQERAAGWRGRFSYSARGKIEPVIAWVGHGHSVALLKF